MAQITVIYLNHSPVTLANTSTLPLVLSTAGYHHDSKKIVSASFLLQGVDKATINVTLPSPLPPNQKLAVPFTAGLPSPLEATWATSSGGVATVEINPQPSAPTVNAMLEGLGHSAGINVTA